jgi:hypothetical protein
VKRRRRWQTAAVPVCAPRPQALLKAESELRAAETVADLAAADLGPECDDGGAAEAGGSSCATAQLHTGSGLGSPRATAAHAAAAAVQRREVCAARALVARSTAADVALAAEAERQAEADRCAVAAALEGRAQAARRARESHGRDALAAAGALRAAEELGAARAGAVEALRGSLERVGRGLEAKADVFR